VEPTWLVTTSLKRVAKPMSWLVANTVVEANITAKLLSRLCKLNLQGVRNNSCVPSGLLIVDEDVKLTISKQKLKAVLLALNVKLTFILVFSQKNAMLKFMICTFQRQNAKLMFSIKLCQDTRSASHFKNMRPAFSLRPRQNMTFAFQF